MEKINYENGGSVITWKIENFHCLENCVSFYSPYFFIGTKHNIKCKICFTPSGVFNSFHLRTEIKDVGSPLNVSFSYSSSMSLDSKDIKSKVGVISESFIGSQSNIDLLDILSLYFTELNDIKTAPKTLIFRCHLRIISDNNSTVNQYKFRSVVEAEHRRVQYTIPNINYCNNKNQKLFIPMPEECSLTIPFQISLCTSGSDNALDLDITNVSENKIDDVFLICELSVADEKGKHLLTATHDNEFKKESLVWRFPTPIKTKYLKSESLDTDILLLDFKFLISEHKTNTWLEEFSTVVNPQTKMVSEKREKDKINLRDDFMCLYIERKFSDVEIIAGDKKFQSHKTILCARSPVFSAMFESNMIEREKNVVEITDLDSKTVDRMLFFMYSEILEDQEWSNVTKLYVASDKYQIMTLKDKCSSILKEQLSVYNTCEALHLADMHCDSDFRNAIQDFIITNANKVFQSEEWKELMNTNSKVACQTMHKAWMQRMQK